jgi:hypothetical protein
MRRADAEFDRMREAVDWSEKLWRQSQKSKEERFHACTAVTAALTSFAVNVGISLYAKERLNDMLVALGELGCGRHSVILAPAPVHPAKFSATDLQQQAMAQVCVDLLRDAGASATDARKRVSGTFEKYRLPKFSEAKLRTLNSRLKGSGNTQDEAYDMYLWARSQAERTGVELGVWPIRTVSKALKLVDVWVSLAKRRDHRHDFFFAPREDSSDLP